MPTVPPVRQKKTTPNARGWGVCLALLIFWGLWWGPVLWGQAQLYIRDLTFYALPMKTYWLERLRQGEFPFWTPYLSAGMPFFADASHQALYPLNVVFAFGGHAVQGITWFIVLHHALAMVAMAWLCRASGCRWGVALWGALVYGLSGYVLSITDNVNYMPATAWAPALLAAWISGRPVLAGVALSMMLLAGDLLTPMALTLTLGLWTAGQWLWTRIQASFKKLPGLSMARPASLQALGLFFLVGLGISAIQWLPTLQLAALSERQGPLKFEESTLWSFPPQRLVEWVHPLFFGSKYPSFHAPGPHFIGQFLYPEFREPWADSIFVGLIPIAMALLACLCTFLPWARRWHLMSASQNRWILLAAGMLGGALLLSFGKFVAVTQWLYQALPFLQQHRYPEKYLFVATLALCWLAALGAQALWQAVLVQARGFSASVMDVSWKQALLGAGGLWLLSGWVLLDAPVALWIAPHTMERSVEWGPYYYSRPEHVQRLRLHWQITSALLLLALWVLLFRQKSSPGLRQATLGGLLLLAVTDVAWAHWKHVPTAPTRLLVPVSASSAGTPPPTDVNLLTRTLAANGTASPQHKRPVRVFYDDFQQIVEVPTLRPLLAEIAQAYHIPEPADNYRHYWEYRVRYNQRRLLFNYGLVYAFRYLNGRFAPLQPLAHKQFDEALLKTHPARWLALTSTEFVITPLSPLNPTWEQPEVRRHLEEVAADANYNVRILQVKAPLPRAYFTREVVWNNEPLRFLLAMPGFDAVEQVEMSAPEEAALWSATNTVPVLAGMQPSRDSHPHLPSILWKQDAPERLMLQASNPTSEPRPLVITESYFPGWRAWLDGQRTSLWLANKRFMAVMVPPGNHRVQLTYVCEPFTWGALLSLLTLGGLAGGLVLQRRVQNKARSKGKGDAFSQDEAKPSQPEVGQNLSQVLVSKSEASAAPVGGN